MTNTECREAFNAVSAYLHESGLGWIVTQVLEQIRFGKPHLKRVETSADISPELVVEGLGSGRRRTRETLAATREYTAHEQLGVLLDAIERALISTSAMEDAVRSEFFGRDKQRTTIELVRTDDPGRETFTISNSPNAQRIGSVHKLNALIENLRGLI